ncbi:MAG TPA: LuxR C-terminal-related transcriptional regulator [Pseudonocardiaceae bacterium]|nr:LuxR C-terminal-related transcriptional regulator [Pseudonocardiaceae bacterium]
MTLPMARRGEPYVPAQQGSAWLAGVSGDCRHFLRVAAAVGMRFAPDDVARLLDRPTAALLPLVDEALGAGVLTVTGSLLTYRDERRWREAAATVPQPMLRSLRQKAGASAPAAVPAAEDEPLARPNAAGVPTTTVLSNARWNAGEPLEALRFGREAVDAIGDDTPGPWRPHARLALAHKMVSLRDLGCAESLIRQAQDDVDHLGPGPHTTAPRVVRARLLAQTGHLAEARSEAEAALRPGVPGGSAEVGGYHRLARSVLALTSLRLGDLTGAATHAELCGADGDERDPTFPASHVEWINFLVATARRAPEQALGPVERMFPALLARPSLWYDEPAAAPWLVRLALGGGASDLAGTVVATVGALAEGFPELPTVVATARHVRALVADDVAGLAAVAEQHWDTWAGALAAEDLATRLADLDGERERALHWLSVALDRFAEVRVGPDLARVRGLLRSLRPTRGPDRRSGWDQLSDTERRIAVLVSQGMTNREVSELIFLSPHTINYHLRRIFQKLEIRSRVALAGIVTREE